MLVAVVTVPCFQSVAISVRRKHVRMEMRWIVVKLVGLMYLSRLRIPLDRCITGLAVEFLVRSVPMSTQHDIAMTMSNKSMVGLGWIITHLCFLIYLSLLRTLGWMETITFEETFSRVNMMVIAGHVHDIHLCIIDGGSCM